MMIIFFRKIRQKLLTKNRFQKYLAYALGEILLVMVGILLALEVNNWNEKRKQEVSFKIYIEQVYSTVTEDLEMLNSLRENFELENQIIDSLIEHPGNFDKAQLPTLLFYLGWGKSEVSDYITPNFSLDFKINTENRIQKSLHLRINRLKFYLLKDIGIDHQIIYRFLSEENNIPVPKQSLFNSDYFDIGTGFYTEREIRQVDSLLKTSEMIKLLKNTKSGKEFMIADLTFNIQYASHLLESIKNYYPEARLIFDEVGIIGSSFESGWESSIPLEVNPQKENVWQAELYFDSGEVKFRTHNSWAQNWGGNTFPFGDAIWHGGNIEINESGKYLVTLDLDKNIYSFKLLGAK